MADKAVDGQAMRRIRFHFDLHKAVQVMAYATHALGRVEKVKLMKLLYIADRDHFLEHGSPITGDDLFAMPYGPVPSRCLDELGEGFDRSGVGDFLHIEDRWVTCKKAPDPSALTETEKDVLDRVLAEHGQKPRWDLVRETHNFPEYKRVYQEDTSALIPYEVLLEIYGEGDADRFRHGRPVIRQETAGRMKSPFPRSEPDL